MIGNVNPAFGAGQSFGTVAHSIPSAGQDQNRIPVSDAQANRFYSRVPLPTNLQGYVRYVVVLDPQDSKPYSIGIKYVCRSKGADEVLARLSENVNRRHKKRVHAWLCKSCSTSSICPAEWACPDIHVTPVGYSNRRPWTQALGPSPRKTDLFGDDDEGWGDDEKRPEGGKRSVSSSVNGASRITSGPHLLEGSSGQLGIDPTLLKNTYAAASAESSQLATQLAWLNLDLSHMAKVLGELRAGGGLPSGTSASPADFGSAGHLSANRLSNLDSLGTPATSPPASLTSTVPTTLGTTTSSAASAASTTSAHSAEASDVAQNMIGVLTSLNVIALLNQLAGTLTDPGQLLLIHQLAAQIGTQIVGRAPEVETAVNPNQLAGLASLLTSGGARSPSASPESLSPSPSLAPTPSVPLAPLSSIFALPSMLHGVFPPAHLASGERPPPIQCSFPAPGPSDGGHSSSLPEALELLRPLSPSAREAAWDLSKLAAILPNHDVDLTVPDGMAGHRAEELAYATPPSATAPTAA